MARPIEASLADPLAVAAALAEHERRGQAGGTAPPPPPGQDAWGRAGRDENMR